MYYFKLGIKYVLFVFLISSCQSNYYKKLAQIERVIEFNPQKADSLINYLPVPTIPQKHYIYNTLKTRIDHKVHRIPTTDSAIISATKQYGINTKSNRAAMAWYAQGCLYSDLSNDLNAIDAYIKAINLFPDTLSVYYTIAELSLGKHLLNQMSIDDAVNLFQCCVINSTRLGLSGIKNEALIYLGICSAIKQDYNKARYLFSQLSIDSITSEKHKRRIELELAKNDFYLNHDYEMGLETVNHHLHDNNNIIPIEWLKLKADIFFINEMHDSAFFYYNQYYLYGSDIISLLDSYDKLTQLTIKLGNNTEAIANFNKYKALSDSIYKLNRLSQIKKDSALSEIRLIQSEKNNDVTRLIIMITMVAILLVVTTLILKQEKLWKIKNNINSSEAAVLDIKMTANATYELFNKRNDRNKLIDLYKKELQDCEKLFMIKGCGSMLSSRTAIRDVNFSNEEKRKIIQSLNIHFRPIIQILFDEVPKISQDEAYVCILSYLGLDSVDMSNILNVSDSCIRYRRKRVQEKDKTNIISIFISKHCKTKMTL